MNPSSPDRLSVSLSFRGTRVYSSVAVAAILIACCLPESLLADAGRPLLTRAKDVLELSETESGNNRPVHLQGVVTACDDTWMGEFFLQDGTAGIFVDSKGPGRPAVGDLVDVQGVAEPGAFAPIVARPVWKVLRTAPLPAPRTVSIDQVMTGAEDGQRVEVEGWIHGIRKEQGRLCLDLVAGSDRVDVRMPREFSGDASRLLGSKVAAAGVPSATSLNFNVRRMVSVKLWVHSPSDLRIIEEAEPDPQLGKPSPVGSLSRYHIDNSPGRRFFVRGVVTYRSKGVLYLGDSSGGIEVRAGNSSNFEPGEVVDVVGFPILERGLPVLTDAIIRKTGNRGEIALKDLRSIQQLRDGLYHAELIRVEGRLINFLEKTLPGESGADQKHLTLALETPEGIITAEIENPVKNGMTPGFEIGSRIEVKGVCSTITDLNGAFQGFQVLVPSLHDVRMTKPASPFTIGRLLVALLILLVILLCIAVWSILLMRKNTRLSGDVRERSAVLAERARLAGDLHDTLEQSLTGLVFQLRTASKLIPDAPERARDHLNVATEGVLQTHSELRRSIWNLTPEALERFDLAEAISRTVRNIADSAGLDFSESTSGTSPRLDPVIQQNLLRIAQEAATNTVKHARASKIRLEILFSPEHVTLQIADDGCGIPDGTSTKTPGGGFGISGMTERAGRIGGIFSIENLPPHGTIVRVEIPVITTSSQTDIPT